MKITHPVPGFNGYAQAGAFGLHFLAGEAHAKAKDIPDKAREALEENGFEFADDRPGRAPAPEAETDDAPGDDSADE